MIDERTETQASLYVLGALSEADARAFEAELRSDAPLRALVQELRNTSVTLTAAFPRVTPPPGTKSKILAALDSRPASTSRVIPIESASTPIQAASTPGWMEWMPWALAACFAVLCVVLISVGKNLHEQALSLSTQLGERFTEVEELRGRLDQLQAQSGTSITNYEQRILNIERQAIARIEDLGRQSAAITNQLSREQTNLKRRLADSEAKTTELARDKRTLEGALQVLQIAGGDRFNNSRIAIIQPTADGPPGAIGASVWIPADQRGLFAMERIPGIINPATQDLQLWLIDPASPSPISAGVFTPDASGAVRFAFYSSTAKTVDRFAVSIEPKGGAPKPTGKIVFASN
jgi:anti-sigma-K factor RskA